MKCQTGQVSRVPIHMARGPLTCIALVGTVLLTTAAPAVSQECKGAPGTSAVEQYCESIPAAGGKTRPTGQGSSGGSSGSSGSGIPPSVQRELASSPQGRAVIAVAQSDGSGSGDSGRKAAGENGATGDRNRPAEDDAVPKTPPAAEPSGNPLRAVASSVKTGSTVGSGFVWALIVVTLAALGGWWLARRRGSDSMHQ